MPPPVFIASKPIDPPVLGRNNYKGFKPGEREILPKGWNGYRGRPLPCDILVEHDVEIRMRDGARLYADVYRSPDTGASNKVPALLGFSPFGKKFSGVCMLNMMTPWNMGIPDEHLSGLEKFEAPDPAEWIPRGYAIISADTRGTGDSDGPVVIMGTQEGEDGYDMIEGLAKKEWCSGAVAMVGNSHLAITQYFTAAQRPPSLKAIAPWEGCSDLFREQFVRGGIWQGDFFDYISSVFIQGRHGMENFKEMYRRDPYSNPYWEDKRANLKNINIPTYITGSWSSGIHTMGSIRAFLEIDTKDKWLRFDPWQEWYDIWAVPRSTDELQAFFDKYLKGLDNGWEKTPKVRMTALRYGEKDPEENIVVEDFPIPNTDYKSLYLANGSDLTLTQPTKPGLASHDSTIMEGSKFTYKFAKSTRLIGIPKAILYVSCDDSDDLDIFVLIRKLNKAGKPMLSLNIPWHAAPVKRIADIQDKDTSDLILYLGPIGMLRASHRAIDKSKSIHSQYPFHKHDRESVESSKVPPGKIVELEIGMWAMGVEYEAGESLQVQILGGNPSIAAFKPLAGKKNTGANKGIHKVHWGPATPSRMILPFLP